jgi:hypothetical protein
MDYAPPVNRIELILHLIPGAGIMANQIKGE